MTSFRETTIWVVGGSSADHHLGSGWLCKRFRGVMGGCITTKGKTAGESFKRAPVTLRGGRERRGKVSLNAWDVSIAL